MHKTENSLFTRRQLVYTVLFISSIICFFFYLITTIPKAEIVNFIKIENLELRKMIMDELTTHYDHYNNNNYKTIGFLLVYIGWLFTSKEAKRNLINNEILRRILAICVIGFMLQNAWIIYNTSTAINSLLKDVVSGEARHHFFWDCICYWTLFSVAVIVTVELKDNDPASLD